ncbi:MAG: ferredoxin [Bacilli bacterium]|jgi:ferredoxin
MAKKVRIDKDACIGCGLCNSITPTVFDWDDDGKMKAIVPEVPEGEEAAVDEAASSCPTSAIIVG